MARSNRVKKVVSRMNQQITVKLAAILLAGSTLLSSVLGLYRDRVLNSTYLDCSGPCYPVGIDAYTAAFTVPDFMFYILVSGALSVTFIPVFSQRMAKGNKKSAWQLSSSMINFMALITLVASLLIMVFAEPLLKYIIAPGLGESGTALAVSMMRVIAVNPFLFAIATVIASMQQAVGRFTFYALAPTIYNIGIIIGATFFTHGISIFGYEIFDGGIMGVALGVVFGSIMQLIVSAIGLFGVGFDYEFKIFWKNKGFRKTLGLLPARSIDQGMDYLVSLVETNLASRMTEGTVRIFQQSIALHMVPINLIGVAVSTAAFPRLSDKANEDNDKNYIIELRSVLRTILWLILPVVVVTFFARGYIVGFISRGGNALMATLLAILTVAILFRCIYHIAARAFYSKQDTKTPLYVSIFSISLNVFLAIVFTFTFKFGAIGLAWAQSIMAVAEVVILICIIQIRFGKVINLSFLKIMLKMLIAAIGVCFSSYFMVKLFPLKSGDTTFWTSMPKFALIVSVSFGVYLLISYWLKLEEAAPVIKKINKILFGKLKVNYGKN